MTKVEAYDGDYANPRRIRYGLNPTGLPFSSYFRIDPDTGVITVRKNLQVCGLLAGMLIRYFIQEFYSM